MAVKKKPKKKKATKAQTVLIDSLYIKKYKPLKLASAHVRKLKAVMLEAAAANKNNTRSIHAVAKKWLTANVPDKLPKPVDKKKTKKKPTAKKVKGKAGVAKKRAPKKAGTKTDKDESEPLPSVEGNINLSKLNRATLRGMAKDLDLKVLKKDSDDSLRQKVADGMIGMTDDVQELLSEIDVDGLKDCIGVFLDLTNATCIACPLQQRQCRKLLEKHQKEGWRAFDKLRADTVVEEQVEDIDADDVPNKEDTPKKKSKNKKRAVTKRATKYNPTRSVQCYEINLVGVDEDMRSTVKLVMERIPQNMKELREIILEDWDPEKDTEAGRQKLVVTVTDIMIDLGLVELL